MEDLLDNFLDLIKLFLAWVSDFIKSLGKRMGGGKEKKKKKKQRIGRGKRLKQKFFQTERVIKNILSKTLSTQHKVQYLGLPGIK
jgi:hypothetical protein